MILFTLLGRIIIIYSVNIIYVSYVFFSLNIYKNSWQASYCFHFAVIQYSISEHKQFTHEYHWAGIQTLEKPTSYTITPHVTEITREQEVHSRREIMTPLLPF